MKIKKYLGKSFQEAFEKMKAELGDEAIILNSRTARQSGVLDFFTSGQLYEITAAVDHTDARPPSPQVPSSGKKKAKNPSVGYAPPPGQSRPPGNGDPARPAPAREQLRSDSLHQASQLSELKDEIKDIKKVLNQVADFLKYSRMPALPEAFKNILKQLVDNEVHEDLAKAVVQTVYSHTNAADYSSSKVVRQNLFNLLSRMIKIASPLETTRRAPYVVTLIGPTGVGKTTTVAKIAANAKLHHNKRVALISADTYRIAAIEQLQTFANIASIPMSVAYSPEDMREAIYKYRNEDLILIDTVGRSQKNNQHLKELQKFIDAANPDEVHLVLSLTSSLRTLLDIVKRFGIMKPNRFIFSKLDESSNAGNILNVLYKHQLPVSYLTTGQTVPNDILPAQKETIVQLIYRGVLDS